MPLAAKKTSTTKSSKLAAKPSSKAAPPASAKIAADPIAWPSAKTPAKPKAPAKTANAAKEKKPKLVRDSFTIPKVEYGVLDDLKARANRMANPAKKSELLRAGIKALAAMDDSAFAAALKAVPAIKTGRPKKT